MYICADSFFHPCQHLLGHACTSMPEGRSKLQGQLHIYVMQLKLNTYMKPLAVQQYTAQSQRPARTHRNTCENLAGHTCKGRMPEHTL